MVYILYCGGLHMRKRRGQLIDNWDVNATFLQYRNNPAEHEMQQPDEQASHDADDTRIILVSIVFAIGFLVFLATATVWNIW